MGKTIKKLMYTSLVIGTVMPLMTNSVQATSGALTNQQVINKTTTPKSGDVELNATNFPDANFRAELNKYDSDGNGKLSSTEISNITNLVLLNLSDVTGIKLLTSLKTVNIGGSSITKLDLRGMGSLTHVSFFVNPNLKELDLRDCPNLVAAYHSVNNETVLISAGMTKYIGCDAVKEHTGHIIIDLRGIATVNSDGTKTVDLSQVISPTLIGVFKEHTQPGFDPATNMLTIPKNENSSDYVAGEDGKGADTNWTFYTDYDNPDPDPVVGGNVTAKYIDDQGNKIADDVVKSGNVGDQYTTDKLTIGGYTFKEVHGNANGTFTKDEQTVTYVYTKDEVAKPETPTSPAKPAVPNKPKVSVKVTKKTTKKLPQTGEMSTALISVSGILLLSALTSAYVLRRKTIN